MYKFILDRKKYWKNYLRKEPCSSRKVVNMMIKFFSAVLILIEEVMLIFKNE